MQKPYAHSLVWDLWCKHYKCNIPFIIIIQTQKLGIDTTIANLIGGVLDPAH